jgi:NAD-dependent dihydropyrimidine dehydrogenase PreA subunit
MAVKGHPLTVQARRGWIRIWPLRITTQFLPTPPLTVWECMPLRQFGAMGYSIARERVVIDLRKCYDCGICRASCIKNAIALGERPSSDTE